MVKLKQYHTTQGQAIEKRQHRKLELKRRVLFLHIEVSAMPGNVLHRIFKGIRSILAEAKPVKSTAQPLTRSAQSRLTLLNRPGAACLSLPTDRPTDQPTGPSFLSDHEVCQKAFDICTCAIAIRNNRVHLSAELLGARRRRGKVSHGASIYFVTSFNGRPLTSI